MLSLRGQKLAAQTPGEQKPRVVPPEGSWRNPMEELALSEPFPPLLETRAGGELRKRHYQP